MEYLFRSNIESVHFNYFSPTHLYILLFIAVFFYFVPILTKNLLPHVYMVEKIIAFIFIGELILSQLFFIGIGRYDVNLHLPIGIGRIVTYLFILILLFKQYHLFNIAFTWGIISCIGSFIFPDMSQFNFPHFTNIASIFYHCLIIYTLLYLAEVRKFKVNEHAVKDNLIACTLYFSIILIINIICKTNYGYLITPTLDFIYISGPLYTISFITLFIGLTTLISKHLTPNRKRGY